MILFVKSSVRIRYLSRHGLRAAHRPVVPNLLAYHSEQIEWVACSYVGRCWSSRCWRFKLGRLTNFFEGVKHSDPLPTLRLANPMPVDVRPTAGDLEGERVAQNDLCGDTPERGVDVSHITGNRVDILQCHPQQVDVIRCERLSTGQHHPVTSTARVTNRDGLASCLDRFGVKGHLCHHR